MEGLHLTADCFDCRCDPSLLFEEKRLSELVRHHTNQAGLTIVGEKFHTFSYADGSAAGVTGTLLLAESHVAIHTWPERHAVTLDVYVCNFENDNSQKARHIVDQLIAIFQPEQVSRQELQRGLQQIRPEPAIEFLSPYTTMQTQIDQVLAEVQSPFQHIQIADTPEFGKIMRIDGAMMTSEKDEFYYHECLVHPAAITHGKPQTALIIGGGDGGSTEELLKYASIQKITLCEIDQEVIKLAREHLVSIHKNAFDSPRVQIIHTDGFAFVQDHQENYDLILLDLTDPIAPNGSNLAESCMSEEFFQACYARLNAHGSLVLHLGSAFYHSERYQITLTRLQKTFDLVRPYAVFIPLYGALWSMAIASKSDHSGLCTDPQEIEFNQVESTLKTNEIFDLQYYKPEIHAALFAHS
ncbi:polyamine aminopropyltransferase [Undibacterium flavidum]|uniref:Polyamine aminopropyltransferase n=1 Tax=Undibacterium flavidum TaxID=2762297 RepID=A0ABR6Y5Z8_9BURK|nr:polyamine aminopropyltransferase [Undibacterium flavidum]MBC3872053.1 polyamine aminopropyltransferase [Undibacterium flavidum]